MENKKISVALCTYNGEDYIEKQLTSILNQSMIPDEIVIVDDCSTDRTIDILRNFAFENNHVEVRVFQNKTNIRTIKNFEKALSLCRYEWIFLCDQDDKWIQSKVEKMMNFVDFHSDTLMLFSNASLIDENDIKIEGTIWDKWDFNIKVQNEWINNDIAFHNLVRNKNYVTGATALISKKLLYKALPINVPPRYYHDCWLAMFAAAQSGLFYIPDMLTEYRIHSKQQIGDASLGKNIENVSIETGITQEEFTIKMTSFFGKNYVETFSHKIVRNLKKIINKFLK